MVKSELTPVDLPSEWRWDSSPGKNLLTIVRNQHIPEYCGACWSFASTSALSDRIKIQRNAAWPDILIAPQVLLACSLNDEGCNGGSALSAYEWIYNKYITDDSCSPYRARGHDNGYKCSNTTLCKDCPGTGADCFVPSEYNIYQIEEFGRVEGEQAMMQEIFQRGPITCDIAVPHDLHFNYTSGIYEDTTGALETTHVVSVVGWGEENGVNYWLVRNSWGTYWGENGFFRVVRGKNNIAIESSCSWAAPKDTWTKNEMHTTTKEEKEDPNNETQNSDGGNTPELRLQNEKEFLKLQLMSYHYYDEFGNHLCRRSEPKLSKGSRVHSALPWQLYGLDASSYPENWDWRNINGTNFATVTKNQHIPTYCGSCWAHGTTSALADRFQILNGPKSLPISLSAQVVVNCQPGGGSCFGGNPIDVYEFAYRQGIPDDTCQQYIAHNSQQPLCTPSQICEECSSPAPKEGEDGKVRCKPITNFRSYYVKEYGTVSGADKMKAEIFKRGPVSCGIEVTTRFHEYTTGIYEEKRKRWSINHEISVVGWGKENGVEYWIGRNSWGTYWGEGGYFRIKMHKDNNGIEEECGWAVPSYTKVSHETHNITMLTPLIE